jgi:hypothetical protein
MAFPFGYREVTTLSFGPLQVIPDQGKLMLSRKTDRLYRSGTRKWQLFPSPARARSGVHSLLGVAEQFPPFIGLIPIVSVRDHCVK